MRARAYCAHPNIRGHWALRCVSRCPYQVVSLKRDPSVYAPKQAFGTHLSTHCSRDERLSRPCPAREQKPNQWWGSAISYHSTTGPTRHENND
ncbi:hypothetical protein TNCV_4129541 [Trichonephila clavipes]|nr:hypothetical protein TNCV_4129541 [Trichonephila clavipes]